MEYYFNEDTLEEEEKRKARRRLRRAEVLKQLYSPTKSRPLREVVHVTRKKQIVKHIQGLPSVFALDPIGADVGVNGIENRNSQREDHENSLESIVSTSISLSYTRSKGTPLSFTIPKPQKGTVSPSAPPQCPPPPLTEDIYDSDMEK